ncbi:hypothetical protein J1N35_004261 [Gossypium stocksii]|uniref:Uncharacterized protein n=1 Tax=Gossypium stocksii TaxID=47602 RepID=A0A9D4AI62_9ROSI|nr:hypothetical protein J1N35_004261 [Gossypium stocksii]
MSLVFTSGSNPDISNSGVARVTIKVRRRTELPPDSDDPRVDGDGRKVLEDSLPKMSYKHSLMSAPGSKESLRMVDDFDIQDGDVTIELVDGIPSITFSDRVKVFIEKKMEKKSHC